MRISTDFCLIVPLSTTYNEIGAVENPNLITPVTRIHNEGEETSFKLLGVLFDKYLSFEAHVSHLCSKISKSLFCINRVKNFVTPNALKMLYYAMVHAHITYCITVYSCANITTLNRLKLKRKKPLELLHKQDSETIRRGCLKNMVSYRLRI
jgi:hypothetical protein